MRRPKIAALLERPYRIEGAHYRTPGGEAMTNVKLTRGLKEAFDELKEETDVVAGGSVTQPEALGFMLTFVAIHRADFHAELRAALRVDEKG